MLALDPPPEAASEDGKLLKLSLAIERSRRQRSPVMSLPACTALAQR